MIKQLFTDEVIRDLYETMIESYRPYLISQVEDWYKLNEKEIVKAKVENDYQLAEKLTVKLERLIDQNYNLSPPVKAYLVFSFLFAPRSFRSNIVISTNNFYLALYSIALSHAMQKIAEIDA